MKTKFFPPLLLIILTLSLTAPSCNKGNDNLQSGYVLATFTGQDYTMTMCSGGYYFKVNDTLYRAYDIVQNSVITENTKFPKVCLIKFEKPTGGCYDVVTHLVKITAIQNFQYP